MTPKTKNLIIISAIVCVPLVLVFGSLKVVQAPAMQVIKEFINFKLKEEKATDFHLIVTPDNKPTEFIFGGDVMLSRQVNRKMEIYSNYSWPFLKIFNYLKGADLTIVNLESPFVVSRDYSVPTGSFLFKANPKAISGLLEAGIDVVSLANNHSLNQGSKGLVDTFEILNDSGIKYIGAGGNNNEAHQGEIIEVNKQKFGFLAYAYPEDNSVATANGSGIADMNLEQMRSDVERLKARGAVVVVEMHAGVEYTTKPNEQQISFARAAIDAGAEVVVGHHPHWPQTFEFYNNKPIIYSLGNLIFDQMWSLETQQGILAKMIWSNNDWERIELVPIKIHDYGQAEIMPEGLEKQALLKKIGAPGDGVIK